MSETVYTIPWSTFFKWVHNPDGQNYWIELKWNKWQFEELSTHTLEDFLDAYREAIPGPDPRIPKDPDLAMDTGL